jgi:hypothetical protein
LDPIEPRSTVDPADVQEKGAHYEEARPFGKVVITDDA